MKKKRSAEEILYRLGWISIGVLLMGLIMIKLFPEFFSKWMIPCPFYLITGYYCPGCGGTRAIKYLLSGHILKSLYYHALIPYLGIGGTIFMISHTLSHITKGKIRGIKFYSIYVYLMGGILLVQFILKNVMVYFADYHVI